MEVRLFCAFVQFIKADTLFAVLIGEQHNDFVIINVNAVYELGNK